jgi:predicted transcriptional regulator
MVSTNGLTSCTDEQFIALWDKHQSVTKIAKILGITERAVNYRRRNMESSYEVNLPA